MESFRAQYTNLVGVLGRLGKNGLSTLYVEDVRHFYVAEDLPIAYMRRELPVRCQIFINSAGKSMLTIYKVLVL